MKSPGHIGADIEAKMAAQFIKSHIIPKDICRNITKPLDSKYVSAFHLRNVSPLQHRLESPLTQSVAMDAYVPQKFHLMTKESFKCPNSKECGKYVCKPTLRGRQANYDKRTAVLDYLPRLNLALVKGHSLRTTSTCDLRVCVQNRHLQSATFQFLTAVNDDYPYSTAKVSCSSEWFEIDPADIHIKGGAQRSEERVNGDWVKGKEAGVILKVTPKHYSTGPRNVKFSVQCVFKTRLVLKDDKESKVGGSALGATASEETKKGNGKEKGKEEKGNLIDAELPYILDFELGLPKAPDESTMSVGDTDQKEVQ